MANTFNYLPYDSTGYFSRFVTDYLGKKEDTTQFYEYYCDADGLKKAIAERANYPVNRAVLSSALQHQYATLEKHEKVVENLRLLEAETTFTICTAHQPNLMTGYLYFAYKILHAIKMASELTRLHPGKNFVPVYYMGSEDNDIEELGVFRFRGEKFIWDGDGQKGAVGRMDTASLKPLLQQLFKLIGPPGKDCDLLQEIITKAYLKHKTVAEATQYLVNELFGRFGLIVLNPDEASLKALYIPVIKDELLHQNAEKIIAAQIKQLEQGYKIQANPRNINLFYLSEQLRERIEKQGDKWTVVNTSIEWNQESLLAELEAHPERFSPNVMLRGLYQETILPNVAFIGGGAEVAYWMQLKTLFKFYNGFFPVIFLRQSVMLIDKVANHLRQQLQLTVADTFMDEDKLVKNYVLQHSSHNVTAATEFEQISTVAHSLKEKAMAIDVTLGPAAEVMLTRVKHQLHNMEQKMLRAEKRKMNVQVARIEKLKTLLFPNGGLQERVDNFAEYYLDNGSNLFDILLEGIAPTANEFLVIELA